MLASTDWTMRRKKVADLLREVADHKLVFGNTREAMEKAGEAYKLSRKDPVLDEPWRVLSAYRLAHISLRMAGDHNELKKIDKWFDEAASGSLLGPLPCVYRLAVLHRLRAERVHDIDDDTIQRAFKDTLKRFRDWEVCPDSKDDACLRAQLQDGVFNMMELASYFLGVPYQLEGLGGNDLGSTLESLFPSDPELYWHVVGHEKGLKLVRYSKKLALEELDAIGRRFPDAILFKLSSQAESHIRMGSDKYWQKEGTNGLKLLATLLLNLVNGMDDLRWKVMSIPRGGDASSFRQMKARLTARLASLIKTSREAIFVGNGPGGLLSINHNIRIYGAIEWRMFRA